jgi:hypothetical protein
VQALSIGMALNIVFILALLATGLAPAHAGIAAATSCSSALNAALLFGGLVRTGVYTPAAPAKAVRPPAVQPAARTGKCDPIVGSGRLNGGKTYPVTSSASSGRPTTCGEAHSVLLSALSGSATQVGDWNCSTDTSRDPIAVCHSSARTIQASG